MGKFPFAAFVAIVLATFGGAATGFAASPLDGVSFASSSPNPDANSCTAGSRILYGFGGTAAGPVSGTFLETGTIGLGTNGAITSWHANFMITDTLGRVTTGTRDLATGGTGTATCTVNGTSAVASATSTKLTYTSAVGTGVADSTLSFTANPVTGLATGSFSGHFGSTVVTGGGGGGGTGGGGGSSTGHGEDRSEHDAEGAERGDQGNQDRSQDDRHHAKKALKSADRD